MALAIVLGASGVVVITLKLCGPIFANASCPGSYIDVPIENEGARKLDRITEEGRVSSCPRERTRLWAWDDDDDDDDVALSWGLASGKEGYAKLPPDLKAV